MDQSEYDGIVLSGGGIKGIAELGALHYYRENNLYDPSKIKEYAGTSVGAINSLLLVCGYEPIEIFQEIYIMTSFFDTKDINDIWAIVKKMGIMPTSTLSDKVSSLVEKKIGTIPTLKQLETMTGKTLYASGVNITKMMEETYSSKSHPDLNCLDLVKFTCNLPLIFERLEYDSSCIVDGGFINNFPYDYFSQNVNKILGIVVFGNDFSRSEHSFLGYIYRLLTLPFNQLTKLRCEMAPDNIDIVEINCGNKTSLFQFQMDFDQKMDMFMLGYHSAKLKANTQLLIVEYE
jgi:predicted acylesterase/phospholipase RssA